MAKATFFTKIPSLVIPLQYFADASNSGEGAGSEGAADNAGSGAESGNDDAAKNAAPSFEELMKNKAFQSEFDKRVAKSIETAKSKWDKEAEEKANEAEKLAKMKADEKAAYEREKAEKALAEREAAVTRRELRAEAVTQLAEKGIPADLADVLNYTDAETCKKSIESVSAAFSKAVEGAVEARLKSGAGAPKTGSNTPKPFENMTVDEKMAYANDHPDKLDEILKSFEKQGEKK